MSRATVAVKERHLARGKKKCCRQIKRRRNVPIWCLETLHTTEATLPAATPLDTSTAPPSPAFYLRVGCNDVLASACTSNINLRYVRCCDLAKLCRFVWKEWTLLNFPYVTLLLYRGTYATSQEALIFLRGKGVNLYSGTTKPPNYDNSDPCTWTTITRCVNFHRETTVRDMFVLTTGFCLCF
jgi:hypothetical protein